jgi:hypothetical protein
MFSLEVPRHLKRCKEKERMPVLTLAVQAARAAYYSHDLSHRAILHPADPVSVSTLRRVSVQVPSPGAVRHRRGLVDEYHSFLRLTLSLPPAFLLSDKLPLFSNQCHHSLSRYYNPLGTPPLPIPT